MHLLRIVFWVSALMAVFSFGLFATIAIQRILTTCRLAKLAASNAPKKKQGQTLDTEPHAALVETPEKFVSALAKLTEALSKAPLLVTTLIAAMFFTAVALTAAAIEPKADAGDGAKGAVASNSYACKVYFDDADDAVVQNRQCPALSRDAWRAPAEGDTQLLASGRTGRRAGTGSEGAIDLRVQFLARLPAGFGSQPFPDE
jgi:hypothetical protein